MSEICSILYQSTQKMVEFSNFYAMSLKHVKNLLLDAIKASNHLDRISDRSQIISDKLFANLASQLMTIYTNDHMIIFLFTFCYLYSEFSSMTILKDIKILLNGISVI